MAGSPYLAVFTRDITSRKNVKLLRACGKAVWSWFMYNAHIEDVWVMRHTPAEYAIILDLPVDEVIEGVRQMEEQGVGNVTRHDDGTISISSNRMKRDMEKRDQGRARTQKWRESASHSASPTPSQEESHEASLSRAGTRAEIESENEDEDESEEEEEENGSPREGPSVQDVIDSWNEFASPLNLSTVRKPTKKRRASIRAKIPDVWPVIEEIYAEIRGSPFLLGKKKDEGGWRVSFDFVWGTQDGWVKILEGQYRDGKSKKSEGSDFVRDRGLQNPGGEESGARGGVQARVSGRAGRDVLRARPKRDGELSRLEYYLAAGYSESESIRLAGEDGDPTGRLTALPQGYDRGDWQDGS
jgi:hypothetical protein